MKLPSIQFYPGDWKKHPGVRALSYEYRGIWFEILLLMHESEQRGKLLLNGKPMPEDALSRALGLDKQNLTSCITTLLDYGVAKLCPDTGAIMSGRMVRDESLRKVRAEAGKKGGNPALLNQTRTTPDKQKPTPSSSSSSSSSELNKEGVPARVIGRGTRSKGTRLQEFLAQNYPNDAEVCPQEWSEAAAGAAYEFRPDTKADFTKLVPWHFSKFYNHFASSTKDNAIKSDWRRAWLNWWKNEFEKIVREEKISDHYQQRGTRNTARRPTAHENLLAGFGITDFGEP